MTKPGNKIDRTLCSYVIEYVQKVVSDDISSLLKSVRIQIKQAIEERLTVDPIGFGKPLRYSLKGLRRLRVGDYRVVYQIKNKSVIILAIKHRKDIYDNA
ncbi:MAG: Toxin of the RelE-RelB toxin-antitoxin system [candidate division TM6 bacterium GW2011_GWF2_37_49]|nr:MAG: Toxin of the RelE-RelB toxin-antitoxin system [candidate division TM6 bacterium GW2011_GWF2_37_49]